MNKNFFIKKYGNYIVDNLFDESNRILVERSSDSIESQRMVVKQLKTLRDIHGNSLIPNSFWNADTEWGIDCSGWIGKFDASNRKSIMVIGAEPNVMKDYKIAYDFGSSSNKSLIETALYHYNTPYSNTTRDLWNIISKIFLDKFDNASITNFLNKCYISDLCFFAPKNTGQVSSSGKKKGIIEILGITQSKWKNFKFEVAESYLIPEILIVKPRIIVLSGRSPREFFMRKKKVLFKRHLIDEELSNQSIYMGNWEGMTLIGVPHFSNSARNEVWKGKGKKESLKIKAKIIINKLIEAS